MRTAFGEYLYEMRAKQGLSLRKFALRIGVDPAFYSRIERGEVAPPSETILAKIAEGFGIATGVSDEWHELMDKAAIERGRIPDDLRTNQRIAQLLPAFYAKLREEHPQDVKDR